MLCIYFYILGNTSACAEKTGTGEVRSFRPWKHLRLRGENVDTAKDQLFNWETPPLARRKLPACPSPLPCARNTSAYAEKTPSCGLAEHCPEKHLRLRGENPSRATMRHRNGETPPLTRRKLSFLMWIFSATRNTSAYAEKTTRFRAFPGTCRKHLRLRGENI